MPRQFTLASRASQLAQVQTNSVVAALQDAFPASDPNNPTFSASFMATAGDKNQSQALYLIGGKALWTKELEVALKAGRVDMLVHCLKDVSTTTVGGIGLLDFDFRICISLLPTVILRICIVVYAIYPCKLYIKSIQMVALYGSYAQLNNFYM